MRKEVLDNFNINIGQIEELLADDDCNTFKVLTDKEIIEVVQESTADEPEEAMDSQECQGPSHCEASKCLEVGLK
ncbi:hypothetical protein T4E_4370 [Trichinella pseudospiralis]|uniref:Uncharacterized protein n=1 Tax=Trichinella pseudospiralis TaxID=6337 RepID=A0A0V0YNR3_TRIPS|nr:hypothetical protein T4E_4370 [Trichinella pseudospiralis]